MRLRLLRQAGERASAKGKVPYAYYRCTGSDTYRFGGHACAGTSRSALMSWTPPSGKTCVTSCPSPSGYAEYERRLEGPETGPEREVEHLNKMIANLKKMISRLIDAYGDGLLDKSEFLTVTDFGGLDVGIPQAMRRSIDFAANSHGIGAG